MTFSLLVSFSVLPVISTFLANYLLPQPVWTDRFLIIHAIPYLILMTAAVYRLRTMWIRTLMLALITGWAGLSSIHRLSRDNGRVNWVALVGHMTQAGSAGSGKVTVCGFEGAVAVPAKDELQLVRARM